MITQKTACWLIGLLTCWLCVPSEAMAVAESSSQIPRIWATSGNGRNVGISQDLLLTGDTASFYLWIDLPYFLAKTNSTNTTYLGYNMNFVLSGSNGCLGAYGLSSNELATGEKFLSNAISYTASASYYSGGLSSDNYNRFAFGGRANYTNNAPNILGVDPGIYCLGKITLSNIASSVDEILFTLGDAGIYNRFYGGDGFVYDGAFSNYDGEVLARGSIETGTLGSTVVRLYRQPVPEPSTYALIAGIGLVGTAWASRRSRRQKRNVRTK